MMDFFSLTQQQQLDVVLDMREKLTAAEQQRDFLINNAKRSVSWIDGVIEILELYRPETPSQKEWQQRMVAEGYAIIQAHVEVAMLEDEK